MLYGDKNVVKYLCKSFTKDKIQIRTQPAVNRRRAAHFSYDTNFRTSANMSPGEMVCLNRMGL